MKLNSLKNLNTKNKILINFLFFLLFIAAISYFLLYKNITSIKKLNADIITEKLKLYTSTEQQRNIDKLTNNLKKIEPQLSKFNQIFVNQNRELEFINLLENYAQKFSVNQTLDLDESEQTKNNKYSIKIINIKVNGDFKSLINYLAALESAKYYINIVSLDFSTNENFHSAALRQKETIKKEQGSNNVLLTIKAKTYWKLAQKS